MSIQLVRGDVWQFDPRPTSGRAQGLKIRPCVVVSANALNQGPAELVIVVPFTTRNRVIPVHIPVAPPEGGVMRPSVAMCEQVRAISIDRLAQ
ncbi:MAG TPA: type II toxin-antitoxin system PemK/MazF family toxin [Thermomicrobiales bacterium]|nr:type II toxin-antitoxin system PemK/MazF family toxin [Thermomicrobiales bacterium]